MAAINYSEELGKMASFAQSDEDSVARLRKRLAQDRKPTTQASSTGWVNWDNAAEILGQPFDSTKIPLSKLEQMRRDPILSFGLKFSKIPLISAPWYIKSSDPQRAAFIDYCLRKIYGRFILAYTNCFDYGYSPIVKRFEYESPDWTYIDPNSPDDEELPIWDRSVEAIIWKPFLSLNPKNVEIHWNSKGEFAGIDFKGGNSLLNSRGGAYFPWESSGGKVADIPLDWALWATNDKDSVHGNLYGYPRTGHAYRYWWSYWFKFGLSDRAFERWADPPLMIYHPAFGITEDNETIPLGEEALRVGEKLKSGANVALPSEVLRSTLDERATTLREWEIQQLEIKAQFDALNQTFEYLDVQKLRAVMVPEQALVEGKGGTSSRNVAATFGDLFEQAQASVMQEIDDHINRYMIPQLLEANFGSGGPTCTKITTGFDPQDIETARNIVGSLANANEPLPVDVRKLLDSLGLPLLSHAAYQRELDRRAEEIAAAAPPSVEAVSGPNGRAGVTKKGLYYRPREVIQLGDLPDDVDRKKRKRFLGLF